MPKLLKVSGADSAKWRDSHWGDPNQAQMGWSKKYLSKKMVIFERYINYYFY